MRNLAPGTYADLKQGRRLAVAKHLKCRRCGPLLTAEGIAQHNECVARTGERAYTMAYRRAA